jgi:hypothetical protein
MAIRSWRWAAILAVLACTVPQKRALVEKATEDPKQRRETFEATLRLLDGKPEYVDEFFDLARAHPATLERFIHDTALAIEDPALARMTAEQLARSPAGLRRILMETVDAAAERPEARAAMLSAMRARREKLARMLADDPDTTVALMKALVAEHGAKLAERLRAALSADGDGEGGRGDGAR